MKVDSGDHVLWDPHVDDVDFWAFRGCQGMGGRLAFKLGGY